MQILFEHLWWASDNCTCPIEHVWFPVQEAAKSSGVRRLEIVDYFKILLQKKIIEKTSDKPLLFEFTEFGKGIKTNEDIEKYVK